MITRYINGFRLVMICGACPEAYDVFDGDEQVGYLKLRYGQFRASVPDVGGRTVYKAWVKGDGIFDPDERDDCLHAAIEAIQSDMGLT